jgi:ketosteroid isomerase-like protein
MLIEQDWAVSFAKEWIEAWNAADLDRILRHYSDDFEMSSPLIKERMGVESSRLRGKDAIRPYWAQGLAARPPLRFELLDVLSGIDVVAIYYRSTTRGRVVIERLKFDQQRRVIEAEALYRIDNLTTRG